MKYVKKKLSELKPYENNPRINDEAVDDVAESMRRRNTSSSSMWMVCSVEIIRAG